MGDKLLKHNQQRRLEMITVELIDHFQIILQSGRVPFRIPAMYLHSSRRKKYTLSPNGLIWPSVKALTEPEDVDFFGHLARQARGWRLQQRCGSLRRCKTMIWGNQLNPLGVAYLIYIMGVLQLVQYTYTNTEGIHSLTPFLNLSHFLKN